MPTTDQNKLPSWKGSLAKTILKKDIADGATDGLKPAAVYNSRPEYMSTRKVKFSGCLRYMQQQHQKSLASSNKDKIAYDCDRASHAASAVNHRGEPRWDGSLAQAQLCIDMDCNKHETMKPSELWASNEVYHDYSPSVFCKHIHQEKKLRKFYNSCNNGKYKKK